jgi:catalase
MATSPQLLQQILDGFDALSGLHKGFRPAHAKGLLCGGTFVPAPQAADLTRAPHASRPSTPVTVRFSNSTGLPDVSDNDLQRASPRGIAIRFHLGEHVHTDIIGHSTNGFPCHTGEEFLEFLNALVDLNAGKPQTIGAFLASHPRAKQFVETPKPIPTSFAREAYFAGTSFLFSNAHGKSRHGRFRVRPVNGVEYLTDDQAKQQGAHFLLEEMDARLKAGPAKLGIYVQMAAPGDDVTNASIPWPDNRQENPFGTITLTGRLNDLEPENWKIIFDPIPRVDGIDSSGDPLTELRSDLYLLSGRRRRAAGQSR